MSLWTSAEAAQATGGRATCEWAASGVSIDTRTLEPGDLFVALTVARDAHEFVAQALEKGAAAALVSRVPEGVPEDAPLLIVEDVQAGLEALGHAGRARTHARVVGITGSVGKTSTKEMLRDVLAAQGRTHASVASYNNHWGVPLTLARMPADTEFAVIEIGMNHPGEIGPLSRMARPHVAMITTVAEVHMEAFEDGIDGIAREKAAIFEGLEPGGVAVINDDIATQPILCAAAQAVAAKEIGFGEAGRDYRLVSVTVSEGVSVAKAETAEGSFLFKLASAGQHFAMNGLGALASAKALGADLAMSAMALSSWKPVGGRGAVERIELDPDRPEAALTLIDDAYNANPTSLGAAFDVLAEARPGGRRVAFVGDMKELGPTEQAMHAGMVDHPAMEKIDRVHTVGPLMQALHDALPADKQGMHTDTSEAMAPHLRDLVQAGDTILVKGSLSMAMARIVTGIRDLGWRLPDSAARDAAKREQAGAENPGT
ncbi:MAG: UDP-N-acetylmuramoyl-tripeptide--D-alanyl-D-alanine ligase [Pseudomonadota bacterium]